MFISKQFTKRTALNDVSIIEDHNEVSARQVCHVIGNEYACLVTQHSFRSDHVIKDVFSDVSVDSAERVIEEVDVFVLVNRSCETNALLLPTTTHKTTLSFNKILYDIIKKHNVVNNTIVHVFTSG